MRILNQLLSVIHHEARIRSINVGPYQTAVWADRCGLSSTQIPRNHHSGTIYVEQPGRLHELSVGELANMAQSTRLLEACIGMAAINAALPLDHLKLREMHGMDYLRDKVEARNLTVIGHFPFVNQLAPLAHQCWVVEQDPQDGDLPAEAAERAIADSDVVVITGSAFTNHTAESLFAMAKSKYTMVIGPTAPLSPILFDYGVDVIAGNIVTDPERVIATVAQGAVYRQLEGLKRVVMEKG